MAATSPNNKPGSGAGKIFSAGLQAFTTQVVGALFFFYLSLHTGKDLFGAINWANAASLSLVAVLSLGLEQVVLRRIASGGASSDWTAAAFFLHTVVSLGGAFLLLSGLREVLSPGELNFRLLPPLFAVQSLLAAALPVRLLLNAKQRFVPYAVVALVSNGARLAGVIYAVHSDKLTLGFILWLLIACAAAELMAALVYAWHTGFRLQWRRRAYLRLLREASPQYLSVLFDTALSRADWILLGIIGVEKTVATADYSFAYRAFEIAKLPIIVVSMLLMPKMALQLQRGVKEDVSVGGRIRSFFRVEMLGATAFSLALCLMWTPVVGWLTDGKYGSSNETVFWLLTASLPMQFAINLMWQVSFSARQYRRVATLAMISAIVNLGANAFLIPLMGGTGAAISFLLSSLVQAALYLPVVRRILPGFNLSPLLINSLAAVALLWGVRLFGWPYWLQIPAVVGGFLVVSLILGQWSRDDLAKFARHLRA